MKHLIPLLCGILLVAGAAFAAEPADSIVAAATAYVTKDSIVADPVVAVEKVSGDFARVKVSSKSNATDPAIAFLKLEKGKWKVLTIGTAFDADDLKKLKIPKALQP